jgi:O-antigen/teichoic acid export membrane protein
MMAKEDNLRHATVRGVKWSALAQVFTQVANFSVSIVLARLLGPQSYGLVGMVTVFTGFAAVLNDIGIGSALIQRKTITQEHINTALCASLMVGFSLVGIVVLLSPLIAGFYHQTELRSIASILALRFLLDALASVPQSLLQRAMRFKAVAGVQIASSLTGALVGLVLALLGFGVWSLVFQSLAVAGSTAIAAWMAHREKIKLAFSRPAFQDLFSFGGYILAFNMFNYWARNFDQLTIGKLLGAGPLGLYSRAYSLMMLPLTQVSAVLGKVMFPALASIQHDLPRVRAAYVRSISIIALITFPLMIGGLVLGEDLILTLLGSKWSGTIPLFRIFCIIGLLQSVGTTVGWIYISQGKTQLYFKVGLVLSCVNAAGVLIGVRWGVRGVALAYFLFNILALYPCWAIPMRLIDLPLRTILRALLPIFGCAALMGMVVYAVAQIVPGPRWASLVVSISIGILFYAVIISLAGLKSWKDAVGVLSGRFAGWGSFWRRRPGLSCT